MMVFDKRKISLPIQEMLFQFLSEYLKEEMLDRLYVYFNCKNLRDLISRFASEEKAHVYVYSRDSENWWASLKGNGSRWSVEVNASELSKIELQYEEEEVLTGKLPIVRFPVDQSDWLAEFLLLPPSGPFGGVAGMASSNR
jgi:hypothetical protein